MTLRLFEKWQDQLLDGMIAECRELAEDADFPTVRRWREAGEKVIGHFQAERVAGQIYYSLTPKNAKILDESA